MKASDQVKKDSMKLLVDNGIVYHMIDAQIYKQFLYLQKLKTADQKLLYQIEVIKYNNLCLEK